MGKVLNVAEDYLSEITGHVSKSLVGKVMRRFEIIDDKSILKENVKELIYEEFRHLKELLKAHNSGISLTIFEFKTKGDLIHREG